MNHNFQRSRSSWPVRHIVRTGGLFGVGFADDCDFLLVASYAGRGVIDCVSGELVARDRNERFPFDERSRKVEGIGPLSGQDILIAGEVFGGSLLHTTDDGWRLTRYSPNGSDDIIQLLTPIGIADEQEIFAGFVPEVRVFGFSPTGKSFVIGTGSEVYTFSR